MRVMITGGAGFLGQRLARGLLERGSLTDAAGESSPIDRIVLLDVVKGASLDPRVTAVAADIADPDVVTRILDPGTTAVFHLAAVVSGMAEADFDLGMRVNLDGTRALLEACRAIGHRPRVVFASSVAVYSNATEGPLSEGTAVTPQTSYGTQKAASELLMNDYTRRGFVDARVLRLPTITVRPGKPNAAASSFASGIIREPLNGEIAVCPVERTARMWVLSPSKVIECLIKAHDLPAESLGVNRIINLPGLSVSVGDMAAALERVAGGEAVSRIRWEPDARISAMVASWPADLDTSKARTLGFSADDSFEDIVRAYMRDEL